MPVEFSFSRSLNVPSAVVTGTIKSPQAGVVKSVVTVTETLADGTALTPTAVELSAATTPPWAVSFTAGLGSTLTASQVDVNAGGFQSPPAAIAPFVVTNPAPAAPAGDALASFAVTGINP